MFFEDSELCNSFFAAHDIDGEVPDSYQTLTFDDLDISGRTNVEFCIYIAEDDDGGNQDWDPSDYFHIGYDVDNSGTIVNALWIEADIPSGFNGAPLVDTDFDGIGDGAEITDVFVQYCFAIPAGSLLDILLEFDLNSGDEDIAIDHITCLLYTSPSPRDQRGSRMPSSA